MRNIADEVSTEAPTRLNWPFKNRTTDSHTGQEN